MSLIAQAKALAAIPRSICGPGIRSVLEYLKKGLPELNVQSVPTGSCVRLGNTKNGVLTMRIL